MLMVPRDKNIRSYTSSDFVKYFAKKYLEVYKVSYDVIFARDCSIMLKIMRKFFEADVAQKEIFPFIDNMFVDYPKRRRVKPIDLNWLYGVVDIYLSTGKQVESSNNKAKAPDVELDEDMKEWLRKEKEKWLK